jgi:S1-C subfamily serine protease
MRLGKWCIALVALALALAPSAEAPAETRTVRASRPLDHHATVLNNGIMGSAFQIDAGLAVTNAHVVRGLAPGSTVELLPSGRAGVRAPGRVIAISSRMDLALLAVPAGLLPTVAMADARQVAGLRVVAAGVDATGAQPGPRMELEGTVLAPGVDLPPFGPGRVVRLPCVRPGFSGGPMFDRRGALVGMVAAIRPGPQPPVALSGFAPSRGAVPSAEEAFVLRAAEIRAEVRRLLAASGG